MISAALGF